jgi:GTP cyclohydrolase I
LSNNNEAFENAVKTMMKHVGEDPLREGLLDTPQRVRKSFEFIYGGYKEDPEAILKKHSLRQAMMRWFLLKI